MEQEIEVCLIVSPEWYHLDAGEILNLQIQHGKMSVSVVDKEEQKKWIAHCASIVVGWTEIW